MYIHTYVNTYIYTYVNTCIDTYIDYVYCRAWLAGIRAVAMMRYDVYTYVSII
jgi:hypothetical protein